MELKNNERIDDLQYKGLKIIQNEKDFCFGIDAVLLSDFAKGIKDGSYVVDLCTGNGIIAILLSGKTNAKENLTYANGRTSRWFEKAKERDAKKWIAKVKSTGGGN